MPLSPRAVSVELTSVGPMHGMHDMDNIREAADVVLAELADLVDQARTHAPWRQGAPEREPLQAQVEAHVQRWATETRTVIKTQWPHAAHLSELQAWEALLAQGETNPQAFAQAVQAYLAVCRQSGRPADEGFWQRESAAHALALGGTAGAAAVAALMPVGQLLALEWRKALDQWHAQWALALVQRRRAELLQSMKAQLALIGTLGEPLEELGLDPGVLLDFSQGRWSAHDAAEFSRWARHLADDEGLKALCERLGRMRQPEASEQVARMSLPQALAPSRRQTRVHAAEEVVGIRLGRDLAHALPSELALLADPDTSLLFDLKYAEARLMCFDMVGLAQVQEQQHAEQDVRVAEPRKLGPMVICVDTSGSMEGMPETVAKAVVLYLATQARAMRRACHLLNFSTSIQTLDVGQGADMAALTDFLQMSFHGGTDVAPALRHALHTMQSQAYEHADLLVISDFVMARLPKPLLIDIEAQRAKGSRFHALVIGDGAVARGTAHLFDHAWVHDPQTGRVQELPGAIA